MKTVSGSKLSYTFFWANTRVTVMWDREIQLLNMIHNGEYYTASTFEDYFNTIKSICDVDPGNSTAKSLLIWLTFLNTVICKL